ncbi:YpmS family protein [Salipaludibacillus daqingensis]|uniref:YpmS family protein n=1 Tax=Salipaludibacillus daqingensis TaxID=3041001 RepID=UPI0024746400|nr:YpmS family protein [Salipaludibacillus daqingensis]
MRNKWKIAFITLLLSIITLIIFGAVWFTQTFSEPTNEEFPTVTPEASEGASFTITTTKEDLNSWLQQELSKEPDAEMYDLYIDDAVYMETRIEALGLSVPIKMKLTPAVTEEGNLELIEENFQVGNLSLPSERVFQLIGATVDLPEWIYVLSEESKFYVDIREGVSEEVDINIKSFDLENDDIELRMTVVANETN